MYTFYIVQCRGVLHIHIFVYGGLSLAMLQKVSNFLDICKEVESVLDGMYQSQLTQKAHILKFLQNKMKAKCIPPVMQLCSISQYGDEESKWKFKEQVCHCIFHAIIPSHDFTCAKPPN